MRFRIVLICIPSFVSEVLVCVVTTILSEAMRDASLAAPRVWKLPERWTPRTRPQLFAKPQTVSHSSHTPYHVLSLRQHQRPEPFSLQGQRPTDSAEEAEFPGFPAFLQAVFLLSVNGRNLRTGIPWRPGTSGRRRPLPAGSGNRCWNQPVRTTDPACSRFEDRVHRQVCLYPDGGSCSMLPV